MEAPMSTMVVRMDCSPAFRDEVIRHLRDEVVVWAHEQDGFVAGSWHLSEDGRRGLGVVEFTTTSAAEKAAVGPRAYHDPHAKFRIASVEVYEQIAASPAVVQG
jgi:hypothetical protein